MCKVRHILACAHVDSVIAEYRKNQNLWFRIQVLIYSMSLAISGGMLGAIFVIKFIITTRS